MDNNETRTTNNGNNAKRKNFPNKKRISKKNNNEKKVNTNSKEVKQDVNIPRAEKVVSKLPKANGRRKTTGPRKPKKKDNTLEFGFKKEKLKIIPLGGLHEIGKNITAFEYGDDIVIVDCGLAFPEDDMLGIDLVIPDFTYLEKNADRIRGLVITHGHEDHIGAIPYLLKKINVPMYATKLTCGLIMHKLEEHHLDKTAKLKVVNQGQTITLGKIRVEFIRSCHSIPDAVIFAIHTPVGTVVHTGDFKIDYTPIDDEKMDFGR